MLRRNIQARVGEALADTPVVLLHGARQTGKTTLARELVRKHGGSYRTLDDAATLSVAAASPVDFVSHAPGLMVIDEIQRLPELLPAIRVAVDNDRRPGRFLLTGSAQVLLPTVSESLAGRIEIFTLWPLSQGELAGKLETFIDCAFSEDLPSLGDESDLRGLKSLAASTGERFHRGILLHGGRTTLPCGPRLHALPVQALWEV